MSRAANAVAAVSFLNASPLIDGLDDEPGLELLTDVPSRLLEALLVRRARVALCPVIDYQLAEADLCIVPVGAIGSDGATHTVRVFSTVPIAETEKVHVDGDSHTSVALLQVILDAVHGLRPELTTLRNGLTEPPDAPQAVLLIGDKVVSRAPDPRLYPHELDLGEAWKDLTGLPFVFATWLAHRGDDLGNLPAVLYRRRRDNSLRIPEIVAAHANGWPRDLANRYLERILRYEIGARELEAIELFWARCHELGLIEHRRPLKLYPIQESFL
jgi:chorismate dehydratase